MSGSRITSRGLVQRDRQRSFSFDGRRYHGLEGDTLASALLANGVDVVGRSFKYHRPRGFWGSWVEDPNGIFDVTWRNGNLPNCQATTTPLCDGMVARSVNAWPSAAFDLKAGLDLFHRFMPAGFYYKTFMWPDWHLFEPGIRKMAGLGRVSGAPPAEYTGVNRDARCDVLVVGAGAAGLVAARAAAETGSAVWLVDDHAEPGGNLRQMHDDMAGTPVEDWITMQVAAIRAAGGRILLQTTAVGIFDHNVAGLAERRGFDAAPNLWRLRAERIILACGAVEQSVGFCNNDRPGVMSASAALDYLTRYGVTVAGRIALISATNQSEAVAERLRSAGSDVRLFDARHDGLQARGRQRVHALAHRGGAHPCDAILVAGGWAPSVHLWCHGGGKLDWHISMNCYVPGTGPKGISATGAGAGIFQLDQALDHAHEVGRGTTASRPSAGFRALPRPPEVGGKGRKWVDLQGDVTLHDVELAAREGYQAIEHLKRYTTLGMSTDQGKTANMAGLQAIAAFRDRPVPEIGTTTFRPPFTPVPLALYRGDRRGHHFNPVMRLALESEHRKAGAALREYGGWLRPAYYGQEPESEATVREGETARLSGGILDASSLGKIEVMGPDAADFLNFIYYNTVTNLAPGRILYGFMLNENGIVMDDGVLTRVAENRFIVSCSSSHVSTVEKHLERWRQDGNDPDRVFVHDTTLNWGTVTISGPKAREIVAGLGLGIAVDAQSLPHMHFREGTFDGSPARVARVSFTGDLSYEVSVRTKSLRALWALSTGLGAEMGVRPIGVEALEVMRLEKGFIIIGKDTDGTTMPHDLGFEIPRKRKSAEFIGKRALFTQAGSREDRAKLVGLAVEPGQPVLPVGAHVVVGKGKGLRSAGFVTSSRYSPTLRQPVALALIRNGTAGVGETVELRDMGRAFKAKITSPTVFDPEGARLNAQ